MTVTALLVAEARPFEGSRLLLAGGLLAGVAGGALLAIGFATDPQQAAFSYLVAFAYLFAVVIGAIAFVTANHAAGAVWPTAVRRLAEAMMALTPLLIVLAVPVFVEAGRLYPWMHPEQLADGEARRLVLHKHPYMNLPFVVIRAAAYFVYLLAVTVPLRRWSLRMDRPGTSDELLALQRRMRRLGGGALPGLGIFATMASWDWLMSLSPTWYSTMFGLNYLSGGFVAALALISLCATRACRAGYLPRLRDAHWYALGRMMFAFLVFWAYTAYFQHMLSWIANKPIEADWFWNRTHGAYGREGLLIIFATFGLPFLVLLSYWIKRRAWGITAIAWWITVTQYIAVHWLVTAARGRANPFSWMDAAALACVGGFAVAFAAWRQRGRPVAAVHDPSFLRALEYASR